MAREPVDHAAGDTARRRARAAPRLGEVAGKDASEPTTPRQKSASIVSVNAANISPRPSLAAAPTSVPLNLLDEHFLNLDDEREPWSIQLEVRVGGRLDPERLSAAIAAAIRRHPLARARLASWEPSDRAYRWEIADRRDEVPLTVAACPHETLLADARERLFGVSPALEDAPPFAVVLAQGPDGDSILLNLHHAAGDGVSAVRLMRSILRAYAGEEDPVPELDPLGVRDVLALAGARSLEERIVRGYALALNAVRQLTPTARVAREGGDGRPGYGFELLALSAEETREVRSKQGPDTTVNDVLLAALAVAISRWNASRSRWPGRIALTMPVNLRPAAWHDEVIGNFASYVTVSLGFCEHQELQRALEVTGERTRRIKQDGLAGLVIDLLVGPSRLPVRAKRRLKDLIPLTGNAVVDTASLSNLGVLDEWPWLGDDAGTVEAVWFSPPGRMPLGTAFGATTVGGRLHVTLRYAHAQFGQAGARAFADLYRSLLLS
ncbi:MAG: hypothetical protein QOH62_2940 [Solirubrobacteraceae bacterium]|nr:hypothetical protein [Solirubrobacteraceae bacterium]